MGFVQAECNVRNAPTLLMLSLVPADSSWISPSFHPLGSAVELLGFPHDFV